MVMFRPAGNESVGTETKGMNRIVSTKVVKRKRRGGDAAEGVDCSEIPPQERSEYGCDEEVTSEGASEEADSNCYVIEHDKDSDNTNPQ